MKFNFPFTSSSLQNHIDNKSYHAFKDFENPLDIKAHAQKLAPIIDCAFFLQFNEFKKITNIAL